MFMFYLASRFITSTVAFLYPGYASYKTLSQRPASEEDLEQWLMYWTVLGCIVGIEYVAEWLVSWLPLYYPMKTLFLMYLALPQTRGSSYLYKEHLRPFFHTHERDIDAALASVKVRVYTFMQEKVRILWEHIVKSLGQSASAAESSGTAQPGSNAGAGLGSAQPPTMSDPAAGPAQIIGSLWRSYGPSIVAGGAALLNQLPPRQQAAGASSSPSFFDMAPQSHEGSRSSPLQRLHEQSSSQQSIAERRRVLEAELASLRSFSDIPTPSAQATPGGKRATASGLRASPSSSDSDLRVRGQYEDVEVPSDVEGYDVGSAAGSRNKGKGKGAAEAADNEQGYSYHREDGKVAPGVNRRTSWFGWPFAAANTDEKDGYEKLKGE